MGSISGDRIPANRRQNASEVPFELMMRHLDHLITILGEDHVGLGSDYDGAVVPEQLHSAADLPALVSALQSHGYGNELVEKLS